MEGVRVAASLLSDVKESHELILEANRGRVESDKAEIRRMLERLETLSNLPALIQGLTPLCQATSVAAESAVVSAQRHVSELSDAVAERLLLASKVDKEARAMLDRVPSRAELVQEIEASLRKERLSDGQLLLAALDSKPIEGSEPPKAARTTRQALASMEKELGAYPPPLIDFLPTNDLADVISEIVQLEAIQTRFVEIRFAMAEAQNRLEELLERGAKRRRKK